jgi:hypothetical protein
MPSDHDAARRRRRIAIAGGIGLLAAIAAAILIPLELRGGASTATSTPGGVAVTAPSPAATTRSTHEATAPGPHPARPRKPAAPAAASAASAPTAQGDPISDRKSCPPSPAMTDNPDGDCTVARAVFAQAQKAYRQTGHIPARVDVRGAGSGTPTSHLSCVILIPANEVTCTSAQYDVQFLLSDLGARAP